MRRSREQLEHGGLGGDLQRGRGLVEDQQFWGDRYGKISDPFGHEWQLATHVEDVSPDEMEERAKQAIASMT